ncbi:MAG TPA: macro domain-containing protein [Ktedonobacteraceae bacterium]
MAGITYCKGDIFEAKAQVIVNTVNCKGVMGKGLALSFKQRYPDMFKVYQQECKTGKIRIGRPSLYKKNTPWILNFPTKDSWKGNSKIEYLEQGLEYFSAHYQQAGITSIAFPKLGTQNGKLSWDTVGPLMAEYLGKLDIDIYIYIADGDTEYISNDEINAAILQKLNEIALSIELLQKEVNLNNKDAKKVQKKRNEAAFSTIAEFEQVPDLAKISYQRIKSYIYSLRFPSRELPDMPPNKTSSTSKNRRKSGAPPQSRNRKKPSEVMVQTVHMQGFSLFD